MKIILLEDVENLGKKWEVKEVADGYARNFLFPKNMAKPATEKAIKEAEELRLKEEQLAEEKLKKVEAIVVKLDGYELKIHMTVGDEGQLFSSVNAQKISSALKDEGFEVSPKQIKLDEPIKEIGEFPVTIELDHGLEAEIRVIVEASE